MSQSPFLYLNLFCSGSCWRGGQPSAPGPSVRGSGGQPTEGHGVQAPGTPAESASPARAAACAGPSGGTCKSVCKASYFVKYRLAPITTGGADEVKKNTAVRIILVWHNEFCFSYLADITY